MKNPTSRQPPVPAPEPANDPSPSRAPRQRLERDEDDSTGRLGAAAGEENRRDDDPTSHYATD